MTPCDQAMRMAAVWDASPVPGHADQLVAVDEENLFVCLGEHPRGEQSAHAAAEYYRPAGPLVTHYDCLPSRRLVEFPVGGAPHFSGDRRFHSNTESVIQNRLATTGRRRAARSVRRSRRRSGSAGPLNNATFE